MKRDECPLCLGRDIVHVDFVQSAALVLAYAKNFGIAIGHLFPEELRGISLLECRSCGLRWYSPSIPGDAGFYEGLLRHSWYYQDEKSEYEYAKSKVGQFDSVLEIGCGKGAFRRFLPQGIRYRGLEFNEKAVMEAKAAGLEVGIEAIEVHAAANPEAYDFVCHFQVLEHVVDPVAFVTACAAALRPGGMLVFAVPAEDSFLSIVEDGWLNMPPHHLSRWTDAALKSLLVQLGFEAPEIWHESIASYHREWHRSAMVCLGLKSIIGMRPGILRDRLASKIARRLEHVPGIGGFLNERGRAAFAFPSSGHTVCVAARKPDR